jgi:hypothetical protein
MEVFFSVSRLCVYLHVYPVNVFIEEETLECDNRLRGLSKASINLKAEWRVIYNNEFSKSV